MRDDSVCLRYMRQNITLIEQYLAGAEGALDEALFYNDSRAQDAVLRRLEALAGAANHISSELKLPHPDIPWRQIAGFRDVLAHGYTAIRLDRVWEV